MTDLGRPLKVRQWRFASDRQPKVGALLTNRGRALLAAGRTQNAIDVLSKAVQDPSYLTPYKAYLALGSAYEQLGDTRNAGSWTAFESTSMAFCV